MRFFATLFNRYKVSTVQKYKYCSLSLLSNSGLAIQVATDDSSLSVLGSVPDLILVLKVGDQVIGVWHIAIIIISYSLSP